jgi:hypothetical protein
MTDYSDLVNRLRKSDLLCQEAANAIDFFHIEEECLWTKIYKQAEVVKRMDARIEELEAALKPFIVELLPQHNVHGCEMVFVKPEELAAAREVLEDK